ncbi:PREDICTED: achaete-scute homolog 2-like [Priapulus caudatus]|uniref:Achaete-scute homolog 2-like n=1 Tax=Priapulus caudatus TaxID=37621 RepID=A0ABM1DXR5_PRICU|nr:PREDICTED: achaete-scute homolog 2-like [Priapulus caudatus]
MQTDLLYTDARAMDASSLQQAHQYRPLRTSRDNDSSRCRRPSEGAKQQKVAPRSLSRRNQRERNRVKLLNTAFGSLRDHVPDGENNKKLSKADTLKSAIDYIGELQQLLHDVQRYDAATAAATYGDGGLALSAYLPASSASSPYSSASPSVFSMTSPGDYSATSPGAYSAVPYSASSSSPYAAPAVVHVPASPSASYAAAGYYQDDGRLAALSTGSASPTELSDTGCGDAGVSPGREGAMPFNHWLL